MPFDPADGSTATFEIESSYADTFIQIMGSDRYGRRSGRATTKRSLFMTPSQISSTGPLNENITISGVVDPNDAGILRLAEIKAADEAAKFRYTHNGTDGYTQLVKVSQLDTDETPDGFWEFTCTLEPKGDAEIEGYGPII